MNIFYLYNSGFSIEHGEDAVIIDYYKGGLKKPWRMPLDRRPSEYRGVYVFSSHVHGDHYNRAIFDWRSERGDIFYVLSEEIRQAVPGLEPSKNAGAALPTFMRDGDCARVGSLDVRAYGSTDLGVSYHIVFEDGTSIFHAGDLNYWHWRDESTNLEVAEADAAFTRELQKIRDGIGRLDAAFFPVDPRMGGDYYRGAIRFCEAMRPALFIPMHFSARFSPPPGFYDEINPYAKVVRAGPESGKLAL
jgi:L-ascorbate metabolism protein UlaG (beta-lactamase superfamily)